MWNNISRYKFWDMSHLVPLEGKHTVQTAHCALYRVKIWARIKLFVEKVHFELFRADDSQFQCQSIGVSWHKIDLDLPLQVEGILGISLNILFARAGESRIDHTDRQARRGELDKRLTQWAAIRLQCNHCNISPKFRGGPPFLSKMVFCISVF